jgi:hypothetical protein
MASDESEERIHAYPTSQIVNAGNQSEKRDSLAGPAWPVPGQRTRTPRSLTIHAAPMA